jgi:glutaminyl-peptide cyclotransferase
MKLLVIVGLLVLIVLLLGGALVFVFYQPKPVESQVSNYTYEVVNVFPHDPDAFTEGLIYNGGFLYESTGQYGHSSLRKVNLKTGTVEKQVNLSSEYFGEGIVVVGDKIIQLTYQTQIAFIYDKSTFQVLGNFSYKGEGWALAYNEQDLIMSNGSDTLTFLNPATLHITRQIQVHDGNVKVENLNELEYINGSIYANIFEDQKIAIINPQTGQVNSWIDLSGITSQEGADSWRVLNGIAYDTANNRLFVTGKDWAHLYEIRLFPVIVSVQADSHR